jgi:flavorubredoxin
MKPRQMTEAVYWVGNIDWDRRLFDALIPTPDGTSYNAYLVKGSEKTVLIDSLDPTMTETLFAQLENVPHLDYIVVQHDEQDHSGSVPAILKKYPEAKVLTSVKSKTMITNLLPIPEEKIIAVADGEILSLGDKTLRFIYTPWVHWPETMSTYLSEDKILFTCDLFGSHLATSELFASRDPRVYEAAKRYYAQIMMHFHNSVIKNVEKIKDLEIAMIAPSHGPIYDDPKMIINAYQDWTTGPLHRKVVIPYVSMHDSTRQMVTYLVSALVERGIAVDQFDLSVTDAGKLAISLVDAAVLVMGTPMVLGGAHPSAVSAAYLINALKPRLHYMSVVLSYGWGGKAVEQLSGMMVDLKVEQISPVQCKGLPNKEGYQALDVLADAILEKIKDL